MNEAWSLVLQDVHDRVQKADVGLEAFTIEMFDELPCEDVLLLEQARVHLQNAEQVIRLVCGHIVQDTLRPLPPTNEPPATASPAARGRASEEATLPPSLTRR